MYALRASSWLTDRRARPASRARLAYVPERFVPPHYLAAREFIALMDPAIVPTAAQLEAAVRRTLHSQLRPPARVGVRSG